MPLRQRAKRSGMVNAPTGCHLLRAVDPTPFYLAVAEEWCLDCPWQRYASEERVMRTLEPFRMHTPHGSAGDNYHVPSIAAALRTLQHPRSGPMRRYALAGASMALIAAFAAPA